MLPLRLMTSLKLTPAWVVFQARQQTQDQASNDSAQSGSFLSSSAATSQATQAEPINSSTPAIDISPSPQHQEPYATSAQAYSSADHELDESAEEEQSLAAAASFLSLEEVQASQHAQAMAPGIDSLLKRRKQQQQPQEAEQTQVELEHATPMQEVLHQQAIQPEVAQHGNPKQAAEADLFDTRGRAAKQVASIPAEQAEAASSPKLTSAEGQMLRDEEAAQLAESDSLLDAIIAGNIDWAEVAAATVQEHASSQQQPLSANQQSSIGQQSGLRQSQTHTPSLSQSEPEIQLTTMPDHQSDGQLQDLQSEQQQQQQTKLQPDAQEPVTYQSASTKSPQTGASQQSEAQPGASPQVSQQVPEQARKAYPDIRKPADIALRRSSRLRLRTTSPGLQTKKLRMRDAAARQSKVDQSQAAKTQGPDDVMSKLREAGRASSQKEKQEEQIQWRVVRSESTTAEEFVRPTADAVSQRPAWASHAAAPAGNEEQNAGPSMSATQADAAEAPVGSRALKKGELKALADRRGLNFEKLLADALSRGIAVED